MGISDADPTAANQATAGGDQPEPVGTAAGEPSPEAQKLMEQLAEQRAKVDELTTRLQEANAAAPTGEPAQADEVHSLLRELVDQQREYRSELTQLRTELAKRSPAMPQSTVARPMSAEELAAQRQAEVEASPFICPGCGRLYGYQRECVGRAEAPHPAVEVVSTDELKNPPDPSQKEEYAAWQAGHTPMEYSDPDVNRRLLAA